MNLLPILVDSDIRIITESDYFISCITGPGLAIRVICAEEPYIGRDFAETNVILRILVDFARAASKVHGHFLINVTLPSR